MAVVGGQAIVALPPYAPRLAALGDVGLTCLLEGDVLVEVRAGYRAFRLGRLTLAAQADRAACGLRLSAVSRLHAQPLPALCRGRLSDALGHNACQPRLACTPHMLYATGPDPPRQACFRVCPEFCTRTGAPAACQGAAHPAVLCLALYDPIAARTIPTPAFIRSTPGPCAGASAAGQRAAHPAVLRALPHHSSAQRAAVAGPPAARSGAHPSLAGRAVNVHRLCVCHSAPCAQTLQV